MVWLADLRVPASTSSLRTVRLVIGGAGAIADLTVDAIEDLQMGAAECAAILIEAAGPDHVLEIEVHDRDGAIEVRGVIDGELPATEIDELATLVLAGTVDSHELEAGPGQRSFVVRKDRRG